MSIIKPKNPFLFIYYLKIAVGHRQTLIYTDFSTECIITATHPLGGLA